MTLHGCSRYARQEEPGGPELEEMVAGDLLPDVAAGAEIKQMMELTEVAATHRQRDKGSRVAELYRQIQVVSKLSTACQYFCLHKALCLNTLIMLLLQGQGRTVARGEEEDEAQTPLNNTAPSPGPVSSSVAVATCSLSSAIVTVRSPEQCPAPTTSL